MMIKQKLFNTINPNFPNTFMSLVIFICCFQKQTILFLCCPVYKNSMDVNSASKIHPCWTPLKSNAHQARKDLAFYQWGQQF